MLATPHMLAGAALGKALRRPWLAWSAAFGSHFLLDRTPHLDSHSLFGVEYGGPTVPEAAMAILDTALGVLLVVWVARCQPEPRVMLGGAFFALVIDLLDNVPPWGDWFTTWPGTAWLSAFHHMSEYNVTPAQWPLGVATQLMVVGIALWVCLRRTAASQPDSDRSNLDAREAAQ